MSKNISAWLITLCLLFTSMGHATSEVEIGGLLLDNTKSRLGHDFYFQFSQLWRDMPNTQGINVQLNTAKIVLIWQKVAGSYR